MRTYGELFVATDEWKAFLKRIREEYERDLIRLHKALLDAGWTPPTQ